MFRLELKITVDCWHVAIKSGHGLTSCTAHPSFDVANAFVTILDQFRLQKIQILCSQPLRTKYLKIVLSLAVTVLFH